MNPMRITQQRPDGRVVVRVDRDAYAHEALDLLGPGKPVFVLRATAHAVGIYTVRTRRGQRGTALCVATRAPRLGRRDRQQVALPLSAEGVR